MKFEKGKSGNPATQFKPGQSGNPKGRPPKLPELDQLLAEVLGDEKEGKTAMEAILMRLRRDAMKNDNRAAEILLNRAYGQPKQSLEAKVHLPRLPQNPLIQELIEKHELLDSTG